MASRFISKLKKIDMKVTKDVSKPAGLALVKLHDLDIDDMEKIEPGEEVKADVMDKASQLSIVSAGVELAYKTAALLETANEDGVVAAGEKLKSKLGVSGSDLSWKDVNDVLDAANDILLDHEKTLRGYVYGGKGGGGGNGGGGGDDGGDGGGDDGGDDGGDVGVTSDVDDGSDDGDDDEDDGSDDNNGDDGSDDEDDGSDGSEDGSDVGNTSDEDDEDDDGSEDGSDEDDTSDDGWEDA